MDETPHAIPYDDRRINLVALPAAFAAAAVFHWIGITRLAFGYFASIPLHELGHALVAWLSGRAAVPVGAIIPMAGFTAIPQARTPALSMLLLGASSFLGFRALRKRRGFAAALCGAIFAGTYYFSHVASERTWEQAMLYSGQGAELALGALLVIAFHYPLSARLRWDFFRFPLMFGGAYAFLSSFLLWRAVAARKQGLPMGTFLDGRGDSGGDMDRLMTQFGWKADALAQSYLGLGKLCLALIAAHYLFFLWAAHRKARDERALTD